MADSTATREKAINKDELILNLGDEDKKTQKSSIASLKLFRYGTKIDYTMIIISLVLNMGSGVILPIFMSMFGDLFDATAQGNDPNYYIKWQVYLGCISFVLCFVGAGLMELAAERQLRRMKRDFLDCIMRQELGWFDQYDAGKLSSTLNENCVIIRDATGLKLAQLGLFTGTFFGGYVVGLIKGWRMALVLTATLPALALGGFIMMRFMATTNDKSTGEYAEASSLTEETFATVKSIVALGLESRIVKQYNTLLKKAYTTGTRGAVKVGASMGFVFALLFWTYSLGFWYGGKLVADDLSKYGAAVCLMSNSCFTGGKALGVFFCVIIAAFSIGQAGPGLTALGKASSAIETMHKLTTRQSKIDPASQEGYTQSQPLRGEIVFRNVRFAYPIRSDKTIFQKLSLKIEAGTSVALVGASGCGKSTIVQLLERFYDVDGGQILIDGRDIRDFNLKWLRQQMALVSQEPRLFAASIEDNIQADKEMSTFPAIEQAAKQANAHDFIMKFPDKYTTYVGEGGSQLSGGQKQRVAIARAILRDPSILILDEATSALDNASEKIVQDTLDKIVEQESRTTIIIAHRLTTVRKADKIIVLDNDGDGAYVAEEGTHQSLMEIPNGLYAALVASQTGPEAEDEPVKEIAELAEEFQNELPHREVSVIKLRSKFSKLSRSSKDAESIPDLKKLKSNKKEKSRFMDVFRLITPHWAIVAIGLLGAIVNGTIFPIFGIFFSHFVGVFYEPTSDAIRDGAAKWAYVFLGLGAYAFIGNFLQQSAFGWAGQKVVQKLRSQTFEHILYQDMSFFDSPEHTTGKLSEVLSADAVSCRGWVGDNLGIYLQNVTSLIAAIIISFLASPKLAAVSLAAFVAMMPAIALESVFLSGSTDVRSDCGQGSPEDKQAVKMVETTGYILNEVILNLRTVAAYTLENRMNARYTVLVNRAYEDGRKKACWIGFAWGVTQLMQYLVQAFCLWYGTKLIREEGLDLQNMLQAIFALLMAAMGMGQTMIFLTDNTKARLAANRIYSILGRKTAIDARRDEGIALLTVKESIKFQHVGFRYPERRDVTIYRDLNFEIKEGEVVALIGASGCGKSTAVQLLERFYEFDGDITIDNVSLRDLNVRSLRSQIGLVNQEPVLFEMSVEENIALGKNDATPEEVEVVAKMANAYGFIKSFPDGFQTQVGKLGSQISGGQKQRIAIARALIRNPRILILDEATSALDAESERVVQEALDKLLMTQKRTTIIIAHRLSTVRNADKLIVLVNQDKDGSRVVEVGNHAQLIEIPHGVYRGLVKIAHGK